MSAVTLLALGACGWHLRGSVRLPDSMATTYIAAEDRYTDFYRELRRALLAAGTQVVEQPPAQATVHVRSDAFGQRVAAVSARNTPQEYQVFYAVDYSLDVDGKEVLPTQHVESNATYSYDTTAVLAKQHEQRGMQQTLARDLASQVVRRLAVQP